MQQNNTVQDIPIQQNQTLNEVEPKIISKPQMQQIVTKHPLQITPTLVGPKIPLTKDQQQQIKQRQTTQHQPHKQQKQSKLKVKKENFFDKDTSQMTSQQKILYYFVPILILCCVIAVIKMIFFQKKSGCEDFGNKKQMKFQFW